MFLIYAKDIGLVRTGLLERSEKADARFGNPDNDPLDRWKQGDLTGTGADSHPTALYAIQSPFDGELHYPGGKSLLGLREASNEGVA